MAGLNHDEASMPSRAAGWVHVVDWSDWEHPHEVARYQVPEAGSHNLWVEDDVLYVAFYNGGLRVVDVSGELMGDLYKQGREIATFVPFDPIGLHRQRTFRVGAAALQRQHLFYRLEHGSMGCQTVAEGSPRSDHW